MQKKNLELTNDITELVLLHNLPFSLAESPLLRRLVVKNYATNKVFFLNFKFLNIIFQMPSRRDIRGFIPNKANQCVKKLKNDVSNQYLSFTLDTYSKREYGLFW